MIWTSLGSKLLTENWQLYDVAVISTELFKVKNFWTIKPAFRMRAYLGQFFSTTEEVLVSKRIYPFKDSDEIFTLPIPQDFRDNGNLTRFIGIKLSIPSRAGYVQYDWRVELEEFTPILASSSQADTNILPGQIPGLF